MQTNKHCCVPTYFIYKNRQHGRFGLKAVIYYPLPKLIFKIVSRFSFLVQNTSLGLLDLEIKGSMSSGSR